MIGYSIDDMQSEGLKVALIHASISWKDKNGGLNRRRMRWYHITEMISARRECHWRSKIAQ
ncbi:MAG: hypothetical protein A4E46_01065 [Methanosaeta sp. PtaU1.Bin016]|nr:MAG: hypothetical protein A4E46_01065 [Methanosaeta sp. PtaU1.Bin016]